MLENITIGQYFPVNSPVHRLDPRAKLILTVALIVAVFIADGFACYALIAAYVLICARLSRIPMRFIVRGLKPILFIVAFTFVLNLFFSAGEDVLWSWGFLTVTGRGLRNALFMALRLILLVTGTQLLTLTTSPIALTDGLESLMSPLRKIGFPAHELAMMMSIALRFIPTLLEEADKIMKAQKARGADFESGNLFKRAKAMLPLLVPLFVGAFRRADDLAMAMEARCYQGGEGRTRMKRLRFARADLFAAFTMLPLIGGIIALNALTMF